MEFVIATKNMHKLEEFKRILEPMGIGVLSQADIGVDIDVDETAKTFEGNAQLKARAIFKIIGKPTIADDSGIEVEALNGEPGVYSARYGGSNCKNDVERYRLLLANMDGVENRRAAFVCAIHLVLSEFEEYTFMGRCEGEVGYAPKGDGGFGYDPIFMVKDKSFSELSGEKKDAISHRGVALRKLSEFLSDHFTNIN